MTTVTYELNCSLCENEWEMSYILDDDSDKPMYCPFCGCDVDISDIEEEESEPDFDLDELDFEKDD